MSFLEPIQGCVWEDAAASLRAQVYDLDNDPITQASIASGSYKVFDLDAVPRSATVASGTLTISDVVFDTLQTAGWTLDAVGYNFRHDLPETIFTEGGHTYRVEYRLVPAAGAPFWIIFEIKAQPVMSS